jgi:hypothetical protein
VAAGHGQDERSLSGSVARRSSSAGTLHRRTTGHRAIGTALKAGYRWLDVYCGGCRQVKPVDLAAIDIHPQACLTSLILMLRCRQCGGYGSLPRLVGLSRFSPVRAAAFK